MKATDTTIQILAEAQTNECFLFNSAEYISLLSSADLHAFLKQQPFFILSDTDVVNRPFSSLHPLSPEAFPVPSSLPCFAQPCPPAPASSQSPSLHQVLNAIPVASPPIATAVPVPSSPFPSPHVLQVPPPQVPVSQVPPPQVSVSQAPPNTISSSTLPVATALPIPHPPSFSSLPSLPAVSQHHLHSSPSQLPISSTNSLTQEAVETRIPITPLPSTHVTENGSNSVEGGFPRAVEAFPKPVVVVEFQPQYGMKSGLNWSCEEFVNALLDYWRNDEEAVKRSLQFFYLAVDPFEENNVPIRTLLGLLAFAQNGRVEECVEVACANKGVVEKEALLAFGEKMELFLEEFACCTVGRIIGG